MKRGLVFVGFLLVSLILISGFVIAEESENELDKCVSGCKADCGNNETCKSPCIQSCKENYGFQDKSCDETCLDFFSVSTPGCKDAGKIVSGEYPDCECGWDCEDLKLEDDIDYFCEDMTQEDCENAEDCLSIWGGPSYCEGETCTADTTWEGCKYKYGDTFDELEEEYADEEDIDPGITPDSFFYFLDGLFGDSREEKIAEVHAMIEKGDYDSARKALLKYKEYAEKFSEDPDPDKREEARRAAAGIQKMLKEIKDKIPEEDQEEFYEDIIDSEGSLITAIEISSKIKELCRSLSELDPNEYYSVCKAGDDSADWQKRLHKELTKEQKEEAKKFAGIMKQCFKTSGQDCACQDIPYPDFAEACTEAAPLATACDVNEDEAACEALDNLEMPGLPPHLQEIMDELDSGMMEEKYDLHMPSECEEAGATTPEECSKIMVTAHAPEECKEALLEADVQSESEGRKICDDIMMQQHAPECAEQGITDSEECKDFMWNIENRPEECKENQIHDYRDCKKFMEGGGNEKPEKYGQGVNFGCKEIEDPLERLDCYDGAATGVGNYEEDWDEIKKEEKECASECEEKEQAWDFSGGNCKCYSWGGEPEEGQSGGEGGGAECDDCQSQCESRSGQRLRGTGCGSGGCECYYESDEPEYSEGESPGDDEADDSNDEDSSSDEDSSTDDSSRDSEDDSGSDGDENGGEEDISESSGGGGSMTGGVINNRFLDYYN